MFRLFPLFIIIVLFTVSCKSFDNATLDQKAYFDKSVKPMKVIVNNASVKECYNAIYNSSITSEGMAKFIKQNLLFESEPDNTYLSVILRYNKNDSFIGFGILFLPFLPFGAPGAYHSTTVTLEAAVMHTDGSIIKTYTSTGSDTEYAGGTGHYVGDDEAEISSLYEALRIACLDLREQIKKDAETASKK